MRTHSTHFHSGASAKWRFLHGTSSFPPLVNSSELEITLQPAPRRCASDTILLTNRKKLLSKQTNKEHQCAGTCDESPLSLAGDHPHAARSPLTRLLCGVCILSRRYGAKWLTPPGYKVRGIKHIDPTCWPNSRITTALIDHWDCHVCSKALTYLNGVLLRMFHQSTILLPFLMQA